MHGIDFESWNRLGLMVYSKGTLEFNKQEDHVLHTCIAFDFFFDFFHSLVFFESL